MTGVLAHAQRPGAVDVASRCRRETPDLLAQVAHPAQVLALQRAAGNRATASVLRRGILARRSPARTAPGVVSGGGAPPPRSALRRPLGGALRLARQTASESVCGPDVTDALGLAVANTIVAFGRWDDAEKTSQCNAITVPPDAATAWDVGELHDATVDASLNQGQSWITRDYRPACARGQPPSGSCVVSVQVGDGCHYAGSANYVIFGTMCRLCREHLLRTGRTAPVLLRPTTWAWALERPLRGVSSEDFTREAMLDLIQRYKAGARNLRPSLAWAAAGYDGWPAAAGVAPSADRPGCSPTCRRHTGHLHVHWGHHRDIGGSEGLAFPGARNP